MDNLDVTDTHYDKKYQIYRDDWMLNIKKKVRINNEIFFDSSMYRMLSKIAFEWYCIKNNISGYYSEFSNIVEFITTGNGTNPVSIIQEEELYKIVQIQVMSEHQTAFGRSGLNMYAENSNDDYKGYKEVAIQEDFLLK